MLIRDVMWFRPVLTTLFFDQLWPLMGMDLIISRRHLSWEPLGFHKHTNHLLSKGGKLKETVMLTILVESYCSTLYFSSLTHISFIYQFYIWFFILTGWRVTLGRTHFYPLQITNETLIWRRWPYLPFTWLNMLITTDGHFSSSLRL